VCAGCGQSMVPGYTTKNGRRYCYYVCRTAQKGGATACAGGMIVGPRMESAVVGALYELADQPGGETLRQRLPAEPAQFDEGAPVG